MAKIDGVLLAFGGRNGDDLVLATVSDNWEKATHNCIIVSIIQTILTNMMRVTSRLMPRQFSRRWRSGM